MRLAVHFDRPLPAEHARVHRRPRVVGVVVGVGVGVVVGVGVGVVVGVGVGVQVLVRVLVGVD